jgi:hypothetical protein
MKELARHLVRARSVPNNARRLRDLEQGSERLDSWKMEEVTPAKAVASVGDAPVEPLIKYGRPPIPADERRNLRFSTYVSDSESRWIERYQKHRRITRSDAIRELILIGVESLKRK